MKRCDTCKLKEVTEMAKRGMDAYEYCINELENKFAKIKTICDDAVKIWNEELFYEDDQDVCMGENNIAVQILEILSYEDNTSKHDE